LDHRPARPSIRFQKRTRIGPGSSIHLNRLNHKPIVLIRDRSLRDPFRHFDETVQIVVVCGVDWVGEAEQSRQFYCALPVGAGDLGDLDEGGIWVGVGVGVLGY
jgi:hypothetical protein